MLMAYALRRLAAINGVQVSGDEQTQAIAFGLRQQPAAAVAAILGAEFGIVAQHDDAVRLRLFDTLSDIDALADALLKITLGEFRGVYLHDERSGDYVAAGGPAAQAHDPRLPLPDVATNAGSPTP